MHQDSFRSVVCRSLSKSRPSRSKDGSDRETVQCAVPCVVTLQPTVCQSCKGWDWSPSQSNREEWAMSSLRDFKMTASLSKHFAEDLLRGAMDLQESLAMLDKFQAASRSVRQSNKKRKPETSEKLPEITRIREALLEASHTKKVGPRNVGNGLHGQLMDSTDELKQVIKDSFRQNLLSLSSNSEQSSLNRSLWHPPSNSSMPKSYEQKNVAPRSSPSYVLGQPDKSKSPSLVAKLMGLDELSAHDAHMIKKDEKMRTVSSPRARFDIEMPKSKKPQQQSLGDDSDPNRKAMQEITGTTQCKGFLKIMHGDDLIDQHHSIPMNSPCSEKAIVLGSLHSYDTLREKSIQQTQAKSTKDVKIASHTSRKQQTKETIEISKRTSKNPKLHSTESKGQERKGVKSRTASASRTNAEVVKKPEKKSVASTSNATMCRTTKPVSQKTPSNSREKPVSGKKIKSLAIGKTLAQDKKRKEHGEVIHAPDQIDYPSTEHSTSPSDESCQSADCDARPCMEDETQKDWSELNEAFPTSQIRSINSMNVGDIQPSTDRILRKEAKIKDETTLLLLSDQSFLTQALDLMGIDTYGHLIHECKGTPKLQMKNCNLYLDTVSEQLERKRRQQNSLCYTASQNQKCRNTTYFSLEALLKDIDNGTRKLNSYTDDDGCSAKDSLYIKLERDLRCTDASISSTWDIGWQDWIYMEETECFVRDVGENILSFLIEEASMDIC